MGTNHYSTSTQSCQERLTGKKASSRVLAQRLIDAGEETGYKMMGCGDTVLLRQYADGHQDIAGALFCHARLCPICAWRRAAKNSEQLWQVMQYMDNARTALMGKPCAWIALSFSPRTVPIRNLTQSIDRLIKGWARLTRTDIYKAAVVGAYRTVEVKQSEGRYNSAVKGQWQPHIHAILCVHPSYFTSRAYVSQQTWCDTIKACMDVPELQVHVERIDKRGEDKLRGSALETAKYIVKSEIGLSDVSLSDLASLNQQIRGRRMGAYYGEMREAHRRLGLHDCDSPTADLTDTQGTTPTRFTAVRYESGRGYVPIPIGYLPSPIITMAGGGDAVYPE